MSDKKGNRKRRQARKRGAKETLRKWRAEYPLVLDECDVDPMEWLGKNEWVYDWLRLPRRAVSTTIVKNMGTFNYIQAFDDDNLDVRRTKLITAMVFGTPAVIDLLDNPFLVMGGFFYQKGRLPTEDDKVVVYEIPHPTIEKLTMFAL